MNSVHEPGPNGDSKTPPSRKTRSKTKPVARAPNWPSQRTRRSQARARVAVSWPAQRRVVAETLAVSQAQGAVSWALPAPCSGCRRRVAVRCAARSAAVSWAVPRYNPASSPPALASYHNTPRCIAIQSP